MGHSPLLGTEATPLEPDGRDTGSLGPSDSSDSGSDLACTGIGNDTGLPLAEALQQAGRNERPADVDVDRVVMPNRAAGDATDSVDEDADLAFIDEAQSEDPPDEGESDAAPPRDPPEPDPAPDGTEPTEPTDPSGPPDDPGDEEHRRPGRLASLLRKG